MRWLAAMALALAACASAPRPTAPPPGDPLAKVSAAELFGRGLAYAEIGDLVRAEQYVEAAIERGFDPRRAMPQLLRICVAASRLRAAIVYAESYLERFDDDQPTRYVVASLYEAVGEHARARALFTRAADGGLRPARVALMRLDAEDGR